MYIKLKKNTSTFFKRNWTNTEKQNGKLNELITLVNTPQTFHAVWRQGGTLLWSLKGSDFDEYNLATANIQSASESSYCVMKALQGALVADWFQCKQEHHHSTVLPNTGHSVHCIPLFKMCHFNIHIKKECFIGSLPEPITATVTYIVYVCVCMRTWRCIHLTHYLFIFLKYCY